MKKQIEQLREFHQAFNLPSRKNVTLIPINEFSLRNKLIVEEIDELFVAYCDSNLVEIADAIIDSMYVLIGTAIQFGMADKLEQMFDEVHRSNMSKLDENGNPILGADGKVLKSNLFSPPNLDQFINPH
jgi:predicted HAD superfamily Cof-like phosphohydrolase